MTSGTSLVLSYVAWCCFIFIVTTETWKLAADSVVRSVAFYASVWLMMALRHIIFGAAYCFAAAVVAWISSPAVYMRLRRVATPAEAAHDLRQARGGGEHECDGAVAARLVPGLDCMSIASDSDLEELALVPGGVVAGAVQIDIVGDIDGVRYIAAWTCGDGACGPHSVWGVCSRVGEALYCSLARGRLLAAVPVDCVAVCSLQGGALREAFLSLLRSVWEDMVLRAAEAHARDGHVRACPVWRQKVWSHIPQALRSDCLEFVAARSQERAHAVHVLAPELRDFARDFFRSENESALVRPLCLLLGFLELLDDDCDLLNTMPAQADFRMEGVGGGLEVLHSHDQLPERTKYQALFDPPSRVTDSIREAFFLCRKDVVLDMLDLLASQEMDSAQAELLARGRTVLAARSNAFGELSFPINCTPRIAWEALRAAMSEEDYYFSVAELQLLFAVCGTTVEVYEYDENAGVDTMPFF
jgi:hypothetical protein